LNHPPALVRGQGLDPQQEESGNAAILLLLSSPSGEAWTDFVATMRVDADGGTRYEAWARRGMVAWVREPDGHGGLDYRVVEVAGENPLERQDPTALATLAEELTAGGSEDPMAAFVRHERLTYPYAYERLSQLFDSPDAPDLAVNSESYAFGLQPGQHGNLDVIQSRSPLVFSGPGVPRGLRQAVAAKQIDVAPTIAALMGFPLIDGRHPDGRMCSQIGHAPCRVLGWQDGRVLDEVFDGSADRPERVYILLLDGQSHTELCHRLDTEPGAIPHLRRLIERGTMLEHGSITNFPSITWPSHNAIGTGAWCGHHGIVNPSYYVRATGEVVSPQGQQFDTAKFLSTDVETLFEAFHRVYGDWDGGFEGALTASIIEPCVRGADHASLERRLVGDRQRLIDLTAETQHEIDPRWKEELEEHGHRMMGEIDNRGLAQARQLFLDDTHAPPKLVFHEFSQPDSAAHDYGPHHEGARAALDETDVRIGHILRTLDARGLFETTLFVITTDHGMAIQDTSLAANPARITEREGMAAITTEPFVYLRDLRIEIEVAHDGRSGRALVFDNDANAEGEHASIVGARLVVSDNADGVVARAISGSDGVAGFALPADVRASDMRLAVEAEGFNARHLLLDGSSLAVDLREALYGS
jgi:hypothetical protein